MLLQTSRVGTGTTYSTEIIVFLFTALKNSFKSLILNSERRCDLFKCNYYQIQMRFATKVTICWIIFRAITDFHCCNTAQQVQKSCLFVFVGGAELVFLSLTSAQKCWFTEYGIASHFCHYSVNILLNLSYHFYSGWKKNSLKWLK